LNDQASNGVEATLRRILDILEGEGPRVIDIGSAIILSLATLGSAWCGYQSSLWGGAETYGLVAVSWTARAAAENRLVASNLRAFDGSMLIEYIAARADRTSDTASFLYERFRPEMRKAVGAWLQTDPFENPDAPPHPFQPQWYVLPQEQEAERQEEQSEKMFALSQEMDRISDTYVLLTVLFASILFFAGMAGTFTSRMLEAVFAAISLVLFLAITAFLLTMPVCRDCDVIDASPAEASQTIADSSGPGSSP
jgi:hypothetical protein